MADVQEDQDIKDVEVAEADQPETTEEPTEQVEESPEETEEATEEPEREEETPPEDKPPSRREQLRIQTLLQKYGDPTQRQEPSQQLDYSQALDADPEVIQQLQEDRQRVASSEYNRGLQGLQYAQFYNNIRFDLPLVKEKLSKLDPMDAKAIDDEYVAITGVDPSSGTVRNPDIGYADFVEARLEQAERLAKSMAAQSSKNIARQAAQTGLRPDGSVSKRLNLNKDPSDMTLEELYAVTGAAGPKK